MDGIQISDRRKLEVVSKKELFDKVDSVKVKITKALFLPEDFDTLEGDPQAVYPVIPARIGIGKIIETSGEISATSQITASRGNIVNNSDSSDETFGIARGVRVFPHPEIACGRCYECSKGDDAHCSSFLTAGKTADGFLRDFAVFSNDNVSVLPPVVTDNDALFIDHVALCDRIIDEIDLQKGEHVVIVGGDVCGIILAQLVIYYQGIPILVDNNDNNIITAKNAGIYYTLFSDNKIDKNVADMTGARLAKKVVYMTGSNLNTDIALKLAGSNATVCFAGFGTPGIKVNFSSALTKQLNFKCVNNGYGSIDSAINLLANKAVDISVFNIKQIKKEKASEEIYNMAKSSDFGACAKMLIIDMD